MGGGTNPLAFGGDSGGGEELQKGRMYFSKNYVYVHLTKFNFFMKLFWFSFRLDWWQGYDKDTDTSLALECKCRKMSLNWSCFDSETITFDPGRKLRRGNFFSLYIFIFLFPIFRESNYVSCNEYGNTSLNYSSIDVGRRKMK